jgi:hypothetical protein
MENVCTQQQCLPGHSEQAATASRLPGYRSRDMAWALT